jgi:hypothetical protein
MSPIDIQDVVGISEFTIPTHLSQFKTSKTAIYENKERDEGGELITVEYNGSPFSYNASGFTRESNVIVAGENYASVLSFDIEEPEYKFGTIEANIVPVDGQWIIYINHASATDILLDPISIALFDGTFNVEDVMRDVSTFNDINVSIIYVGDKKATISNLRYTPYSEPDSEPDPEPDSVPDPIPVPYSPICFTGDAIVQTDQGFVKFERLTVDNTINGRKIEFITKTKTHEKHLICIDADAFSTGVPFTKTLVSRNHKILYNEEMICAKDLTDLEGVYKTKYRDQLLYNLVISNGGNMVVNGLTVETLDRTNTVAQLYALPPDEFAEAVSKMNQFTESIIKLI